jgi:hypothetical protein
MTKRSAFGLGWCSLLLRIVHNVNLCFCNVPVRGSPWCRGRRKGPDGPRIGVFQKDSVVRNNLGILDNRLRIVVDKLVHLRNDQLGKLVSP